MSVPEAGQQAPDVELPDETGTVHRLADQKGRWTVLYFYPKDDTPGCNTEACQFRDLNEDYVATDADVATGPDFRRIQVVVRVDRQRNGGTCLRVVRIGLGVRNEVLD